MNENIVIKGAREHNLRNVDVTIPRDKLVVMTGLSGSGKSSLAFDTIYAEGQRRYVESLSSYARQFLGQMEKPDVDAIDGLSPAISIDQKTTSRNPRSTVGTVTEIHDYLRLLWARVGHPHCPSCGKEIRQQTVDQMVDAMCAYPERTRFQVLSPVIRAKKGEHVKVFEEARKSGFVRVRVDGDIYEVDDVPALDKQKRHSIEIVVDRLVVRPGKEFQSRLADSIETACTKSGGLVIFDMMDGNERIGHPHPADGAGYAPSLQASEGASRPSSDLMFSMNYACPNCNISIEELAPRMFSFNSPFGACPVCSGLGSRMVISEDILFPDRSLTLRQGGLNAMGFNSADGNGVTAQYFAALGEKYGFTMDTPIKDIPPKGLKAMLYGTGAEKVTLVYDTPTGKGQYATTFEGVIPAMERRYEETSSEAMKVAYEEYMAEEPCPACSGQRLKPEALGVTVGDKNLAEVSALSIMNVREFFRNVQLTETEQMIAAPILREIDARLGFLTDVGLGYLTLGRAAGSLSGGEAQRIRLATQIGSALMGVLYILDEPSIGLHQRDNHKLIATLKRMRDLGNTLIVVEHDEDTMKAADWIIDVGPGAGIHGGNIVAEGTFEDICNNEDSITGSFLSGRRKIAVPASRRTPTGFLGVRGAKEHNLKNVDLDVPLGCLCCVTGVSGSGKSSLVNEILYKHLAKVLNRAKTRPGKFDRMEGVEQLDKIICIDQSPIGRTPRSNPATYTGLFDQIRKLFAATPEAKARGYKENRFSFNVKGGRCESCSGDGLVKIEMHFLPDIYVPCEVCKGRRYNRETLEVTYKGKNIYDVLEMNIEEAMGFFENHQSILRKLETLYDVGLGYMKLGQASTTLSGGEAQRVKLATELSRRATGKTIYVLDEPTTGLHMADVEKLISVLQQLTDAGNTVIVIEHNLDVIKVADWLIDLGPEGGDEGGTILCTGTPEAVADCEASYTGHFLREMLGR